MFLLQGKTATYQRANDSISCELTSPSSPAQRKHHWTQLRGALPKLEGDSVYITGFTPFRAVIRFT